MSDTTFQAKTWTQGGTARDAVSLPTESFDGTVNMPVMHRAVTAYLANQRQGNAATKTRGFVIGGNQKPWKQKGTGRARQGSTRAPHWVGGGTVFGPHPRSYEQKLPRQMRQLALKSALNARARESAIQVIDTFSYDAPKTSQLLALLARLGVAEQKVLILTDGVKPNVYLSGRNLPRVHVMPYADATTYHVLWSDVVLVESGALGHTLSPVAERAAEPAAKKAAKAPASDKPAKLQKAEAKRERKAAAPAAPKKAKAPAKTAAKPAAKKTTGSTTSAKKSAPKKKGK
jgi:large subunit ribosomal protein L4